MKLQAQYSKATIISSVGVLLIAGIGYYFLLNYALEEQLDETLRVEEVEILDYVNKNNVLPPATTYKDQRIEFKETTDSVRRHFNTLKLRHQNETGYELSRRLTFPLKINETHYAASVTKSQKEKEELLVLVLLITLGLIILLALMLFFFNRILLKRLWRPFHAILSSIKNFDVNSPAAIKTQNTRVDEFNEMNIIVHKMTEKVVKDYQSLKDFTNNASHEIQTPLAVINSKLDLLIQDPGLSEESHRRIHSIYNSVDRMSRLSQSLLLLTKIENNQFAENITVDIKDITVSKIGELEEWIQENSLIIHAELDELSVSMNGQLAETLMSNLVVNAIKHSPKASIIKIVTGKEGFSISNPGERALDTRQIFDRFWKSESSDGTGLGLAIVNQICSMYQLGLSYEYLTGDHHFRVNFSKSGQHRDPVL